MDPARARRRRIGLIIIAAIVLVAAAAWLAWWLVHGRHHVSTDDAYVGGDLVQVNALVAGTVLAIDADDTDQVVAGQKLVELDPTDPQLGIDAAEAALGAAVRAVRQMRADAERLGAQVEVAAIALERARADVQRRSGGPRAGTISDEELAHARLAERQAAAELAAARAALAGLSAQVDGTTIASHPQVQQAAARLRDALLTGQRGTIVAPLAGMVARRTAQVGQRVQPGQPLLAVVPLDQVWVDANFKESQLRAVHPGQEVRLRADLYGSRVVYHGRVAGLAAGTGAAFALLPAQNATGNWIKIVQRLPVRIVLDPAEVARHPLRIGLSMQVDVALDGVTRAGPAAPASPVAALRTSVPAGLAAEAERTIAAVIARNLGDEAGPAAPPR